MRYDVRKLFEVAIDLLCIAGSDGRLKKVNPAFMRTLGWTPKQLLSRPLIEFVHPEDVKATLRELAKLAHGTPTISLENRCRCADESFRTLLWTAYPDAESGLVYAVGRDVTEFKSAQERFRLAITSSPTPTFMIDAKGRIALVNDAIERLLGYRSSELIGNTVEVLLPERHRSAHPDLRREFFRRPTARPMGGGRDLTARHRDGSEYPVEIGLNPVRTAEGTFVLGTIVDLTARKRAEEKNRKLRRQLERANLRLRELAETDALTGLKNRRAFRMELAGYLRLARRNRLPLSLMMADVDGFKAFNDRYGHPAGDDVLRGIASVLRSTARDSDVIARYGGEEFSIALPETDRRGAIAIGERFRRAIETHAWPRREITASFGVSTVRLGRPGRQAGTQVDALIADADRALYYSKEHGRNRVTHVLAIGE